MSESFLDAAAARGRYLGLNTANGAVIDNDGELESIEAFGGYVSYRQVWSARWRSNLSPIAGPPT